MLCLFLCMCVHISMASSVSASMLPYKLFYDMSIWPVFAVITAGYIWSISLPFMTCLIWTVSLSAMTSIEYNLPSRTIYDLPSIYDLHCCCLLWTHIDALYRTNYHLWSVSLHSMTRLTVWVFYELIRFKIQNFPSPSCNMLLCPICSMGSMAAHICIYDSYLLILWHVYSINCNIWPSMTLYYCLLWPICQCDCYLLSLLVSMLKKYCFQLVHPPCFSFLWCFFFQNTDSCFLCFYI